MKLPRTRQSCALFSPPQYPAEVQAKLETEADCKYYSRNHLQALLHQAGMSRLVGPNMRKLWRLKIETKDLSVFQVQGLTAFYLEDQGTWQSALYGCNLVADTAGPEAWSALRILSDSTRLPEEMFTDVHNR